MTSRAFALAVSGNGWSGWNKFGIVVGRLARMDMASGSYMDGRNIAHGGPLGVPMLTTWLASLVRLGRLDDAREIGRRLVEFDPGFSLTGAGNDPSGFSSEPSRERIVDALRKVRLTG